MTALDKVFIDSNISLYLIDNEASSKKQKAEALLSPDFIISTQVIAENVNVCLKKIKLDKLTTFDFAKMLLKRFQTVIITPDILLKSFDISIKYQVSSWDAIILATALHYGCTILYSEDMHDGLVVEDKLKIINPFKSVSTI
jgi:predicted nucleic acid-binding protein